MRPIGKRAIGRRITEEKKTDGGILLSSDVAEKERNLRKAEIIASNIDDVSVGDIVLYSKMFGTPYKEDLMVFDETDILVVIENDSE